MSLDQAAPPAASSSTPASPTLAEAVAAFVPGRHPATDLALDLADAAPTARVIGVLAQLDAETAGYLAGFVRRLREQLDQAEALSEAIADRADAAACDLAQAEQAANDRHAELAAANEAAFNLAGAVVTCIPDAAYALGQLRDAVGMGNIDHARMRRAQDGLERVAAELARVEPTAIAVIEQAAEAEALAHANTPAGWSEIVADAEQID